MTTHTAPIVDLRTHPDWAPVYAEVCCAGWDITTWEEPPAPGTPATATTLVVAHGPTLRLAVLAASADPGSEHAIHHARGWLALEPDLDTALAGAEAEGHQPDVVVLDIDTHTHHVAAFRRGQLALWTLTRHGWQPAEQEDLVDLTSVVVATPDTALTRDACGSLRTWLSQGLQRRRNSQLPQDRAGSPHGMLAVVRATAPDVAPDAAVQPTGPGCAAT